MTDRKWAWGNSFGCLVKGVLGLEKVRRMMMLGGKRGEGGGRSNTTTSHIVLASLLANRY